MRPHLSLRARIALAGGLIVFLTLLAASLVLYPAADRDLHDQLDNSLITTAAASPKLAQELKQAISRSNGTPSDTVISVGDTLIQFVDGTEPAGTPTPLAPISVADTQLALGNTTAYFDAVKYQNADYRVYTSVYDTKNGMLLRVAKPQSDALAPLSRLRMLLIGLVLGGALAAAFAARLLAGRVLRPVGALTDTVEHVARTQDLSTRVRAGGQDEIGRLARSFTAMMSALDGSIQQQRRLVADASHELRTPLTSLTTNLELLAEPGGLADPQAAQLLAAAREQSGELKSLINDLVDLARYGETEAHYEDLRLDLLAAEVIARAAKRAPKLRYETDLEPCLVTADPDAIERALGNLLDNAVKWSPPDSTIRVSVGTQTSPGAVPPEQAWFRVADEGPGIPEADLPHIFDRFYRSTAARAKPGSGLGLSIVRQIADTHGGHVLAQPRDPGPGVEFRFVIPAAR
jgi:two-component system sensor histidine kinase MprB